MATLLLPSHALNNTKTLTLSRPISDPKTLSLSSLFPALSPSRLGASSHLNPVHRKASRTHLVYCMQGPPPSQEIKLELSTVKKLQKWMDKAENMLYDEIRDKMSQDYKIADDLLVDARLDELFWIVSGRDDNIDTAVRAIVKLGDWSNRKLKELSETSTQSKLWELVTERDRIREELPEEEVKEEAPRKVEDETTQAVTERKLEGWIEEAVAWLDGETKGKIEKEYDIVKHLLKEAHGAENIAVLFSWNRHVMLKRVNIAENAIKKLADWSARKLKELSELPKKSKLQEFRETKVQLPEMMKPHELKEQKTAFIHRFDEEVKVTEAKKNVLDSLKDQEMVCTKKTVEELGEAYEMAKKQLDEAEEAFIMANMEASFFKNLSEKQKKAIKKLADDWSDSRQ